MAGAAVSRATSRGRAPEYAVSGWGLLLPALAGFFYACSALLLKGAFVQGANTWRVTLLSNLLTGALFQLFWFSGSRFTEWSPLLLVPIAAGGTFFLGQILTFLALQGGHISVATPVMGCKVLIIVAISALVLKQPVPLEWWLGAALVAISVALLSGGKSRPDEGRHGRMLTVFWAFLSALMFSITDLIIQEISDDLPPFAFIPVVFGTQAVLSLALIPWCRFGQSRPALGKRASLWLGGGVIFNTLQILLMALSLSTFGRAAEINIIFNSRGLWSVILAAAFARYFASGEHNLPRSVLVARLIGAALLLAAIVVVL